MRYILQRRGVNSSWIDLMSSDSYEVVKERFYDVSPKLAKGEVYRVIERVERVCLVEE